MHGKKPAKEDEPAPYSTLNVGVWKILLLQEPPQYSKFIRRKYNGFASLVPLARRFLSDIYQLHPTLFVLVLLTQFCIGIEATVLLHLSNQLLYIIEGSIVKGSPDAPAILTAAVARVLCLLIFATISWYNARITPKLRTRITYYFQEKCLRDDLNVDLAGIEANRARRCATEQEALSTFDSLSSFLSRVISLFAQLWFIYRQPSGGVVFTALCTIYPIYVTAMSRSLWMKPHVLYSEHPQYLRLMALNQLGQSEYREDILSSDISDHVVSEYKKARRELNSAATDHPDTLYRHYLTPLNEIMKYILQELPMIYCTIQMLLLPKMFSVTSIAILQQRASVVRTTLQHTIIDIRSLENDQQTIRNLYEAPEITLVDGKMTYPNPEVKEAKGMSLEMRNVTFTYPGAKAKGEVLKGVSFKIEPGQLVMVVGSNGSGKSTIVKLFTRLYDATSGQVLVDGRPIQEYRQKDLRQATAVLTQNHRLLPLSFAENIGWGLPEQRDNADMLAESARDGGAADIISQHPSGLQTVLEPIPTAWGYYLDPKKASHGALKA
ncbi:hypothetical protein BD779DRAFT_1475611, partial [Infundibulicybe gibba]